MSTTPEPNQTGVRFGQPSAATRPVPSFGRGGTLAGVAVVVAALGGLAWAGAAGNVSVAAHPRIFGGTLVLEDQRPLTVIDLATAKVNVRLQGVDADVGARTYGEIEAVPVSSGTMLVDRTTGTFNLLGRNDYVVDTAGSGVGLGSLAGSTGADAFSSGSGAYIVRHAPASTVSLVDESTVVAGGRVETAARNGGAVSPKGFADLGGSVASQPGAAAVEPTTGDLWVLVSRGPGCDLLQLRAVPTARQGLTSVRRASLSGECSRAAVEAVSGVVAVASPGLITLFTNGRPAEVRKVRVAGTASATSFLPVTGATTELWFLVHSESGWSVVGADNTGRASGPQPLGKLAPDAKPATPAMSKGVMYTLDRASPGQPDLWRILPRTGAMVQVRGEPQYPAEGPTEKATFESAQVIVDGPRLVFNNPGSLLAVVVFTDETHPPVVVDKSSAVTLSATGPADLGITVPTPGSSSPPTTVAGEGAVPAIQPVSKQVTCATTTQKPYAPQITSVSPSSSGALVAWSYVLLDQTDCEPDSWSVRVTALSGAHQPDQPVQLINGQNQLLFGGLRPATTYQAVVTAYLNALSTASAPVTFTTQPRGPDSPDSVSTTSDGKGDWIVSWTPCTTPACIVPADQWNVLGSACGTSYVGQPPTIQVSGSQTSLTINADSLGLLGDSLSFSVQGSLASGLLGNPTPDHACTQSWRPPDPNFIRVTGSGQQAGQTITATVRVSTSEPALEAFGSASTLFVFQLGGTTVGPTSATSATFSGLAAGQTFTPTVQIYPSGHSEASVTITGPPFSKTLSWPANLSVTVDPTVDNADPNQGAIQLSFANVPPGPMSTSGTYVCGSTQSPPFGGALADGKLTVTVNLVEMGGSCRVTATLSDQDAAVYGRPSDPIATDFTIGTQPDYAFSASIPPQCEQNVCLPQRIIVGYTGSGNLSRGGNWSITTKSAGSGSGGVDVCAKVLALQTPPSFPVEVDLPVTCLNAKQVDVSVSWMYLGMTTVKDLGVPAGNPVPPPSTTTTTTKPAPPTTARTHASTSSAGGPLVVAWFVGLLAGASRKLGKRRRKRNT